MEITEKDLEQEIKLNKIINLFVGLTNEQWLIIEALINEEFDKKSKANKLNSIEAEKIMREAAKKLDLRFI